MLLVEEADYNLLGRDLIVALGINLIVRNSQIMVTIYKLTCEDEDKINPKIWHTGKEAGKLVMEPISIEIERPEDPIRIRQYPIPLEGRRGLKPIIEDLIRKGILEPCMSRHNTPILAIKKADGNYRLWIEGYTQAVNFLYEKLTEGDNIKWTKEDDDKLEKLELKLASIPALSVPSLEKPFHLYVNVEKGVAHGVLVQEWGGVKRPVAYLSEMLHPVSHSWPVCIQAIAATAILVEESRKLTFGALLRIRTQPTSDLGVSPYEMMFGLPFLTTQHENATYECRKPFPWTEIKANVPLGSWPGSQTPMSRSLTLQGSQRNALDSNISPSCLNQKHLFGNPVHGLPYASKQTRQDHEKNYKPY
ncbi:hypothetical protein DUI87_03210 [Hirundo rustica rustica]|uniref:Reverse transcriptase/retrotransposon-derived protein RNase H-like domain-containing protein n=1 Tax=Hirundo rustica rustica TaxID=333673 RepID=A0A3M0L285_HIRRU|nr:hypothetical protein DUI87_03210 [Hirundo rustica rustica]